ncbi:putative phage tail assembly chaperone [Mannheimia sp. E30BD]|uniref:putative phage tail assembly chaperone n=1 Tax=Mannheimia sp. E30BD TaxID=3278708 RepID=UPI00359D36FD
MKDTNVATSILAKLGLTKQEATVTLGDVEFTFRRDLSAYDSFVTDFGEDNKLTPAKDYLLAIIEPSQREQFSELLPYSEVVLNILKAVNEAFAPAVEIKLKK